MSHRSNPWTAPLVLAAEDVDAWLDLYFSGEWHTFGAFSDLTESRFRVEYGLTLPEPRRRPSRPNLEDLRAWLQYVHGALTHLPPSLHGYLQGEWSFHPALHHRYDDCPDKSDQDTVDSDESESRVTCPRCRQDLGLPPFEEEQYRVTFSWATEEDAEHSKNAFRAHPSGLLLHVFLVYEHRAAPIQEPLYVTHRDVMVHGGLDAVDELQAEGTWTHPTTASGSIPLRKMRSRVLPTLPPHYDGTWQYIGEDHPSWRSDRDRDWWLPKQWKRDKTVQRPGRRR